jgi:predicted GTPase
LNISGNKEINPSDALRYMTREGSEAIARLIDATLALSFPEESAEERKQFGLRYMAELLNKIFEINSAMVGSPEMKKKLDSLKKNEPTKQA